MTTVGSRARGLPEEVAAYVRELILSGKVRPGEFLRLEPIAEAVGVSNTPVREGLLALRSEGFVKLVPRRGFMVETFTAEDVHDIFWAQGKLAGELAARAAKRITPEEIARLEEILDDYEKAVESGDEERIGALGHAFHRQVNLAAHSHRLALILGSIVQHLPNRFYAAIEGHVEATRQDHRKIIEALRSGDTREARKLTEGHLQESTKHLVELLRQRGLWDGRESA
ncbi:GntR family transcriptional regulator [Nocardiopsis sp. EMB25]|uniref:GntR family transcriptional regulator n=1 Tax=Nocardiopsis TaxID=2013 RepID=UPI00037B11E7|nr:MULTISPECIES: GntR family transcriptional regulator [Nocardiopsis]MCY9784370.1 GntR family transcriptional regulator [Nocardiopsis sp. EMB25]